MGGPYKQLDSASFQRIADLQDSGQFAEVIRLSGIFLTETTDPNEQACLLFDGIMACHFLDRLAEARQMLGKLKRLDITDVEGRLNAEFCEPCQLILEKKLKQGVAAYEAMLQRHGDLLRQGDFRYLYERIQVRRALTLYELAEYTKALPIFKEAICFLFDGPDDEQSFRFALAVCLEQTGDSESAKAEYIRVIEFGFKNDDEERARYRLSRLYSLAGGFAQALQQLETIVRDHPNGDFVVAPRDVYEGLSRTKRQLGDIVKAEHYMDLARKSGRRWRWPWVSGGS